MIKKEDNIMETIEKYPQVLKVLMEFGFGCVGCGMARFESIEQGAKAHQIEVEKLLEAMNKAVE